MGNKTRIQKMTILSMFIAIELIMAMTPIGYLNLGAISITTMHIPVIFAGILLGPTEGAILGFVFGMTSFLKATFAPTITSFCFSPFYSVGDIHGNFFPYNFIEQREWGGSLARVYSFVQEERRAYGDNLLLLDNGDILQGQPSAYYYNFMDTVSTHIASAMMNYMGYNAGNMGNHDVERRGMRCTTVG